MRTKYTGVVLIFMSGNTRSRNRSCERSGRSLASLLTQPSYSSSMKRAKAVFASSFCIVMTSAIDLFSVPSMSNSHFTSFL